MGMFDKLIANLQAAKKTIVFTEGTDARILSATDRLLKEGLMGVVLCGNVDEVKAAAAAGGFTICCEGVTPQKIPDRTYDQTAGMVSWTLLAAKISES